MGEEKKENMRESKDLADLAIEAIFTKEENEKINREIEEEREIEEAKARCIFNPEDLTLNLSKRRTTDLKGNARVIFPKKSSNFQTEAKIETLTLSGLGGGTMCPPGFKNPISLEPKFILTSNQAANLSLTI